MSPHEDHDVRALLSTTDTPLPRVDIPGAIRAGRNLRRRRRTAAARALAGTALAATAAVVAFGPTVITGVDAPDTGLQPAAAATSIAPTSVTCRAQALPLPAGTTSRAGDLVADPTGRYIVSTLHGPGDRQRPVLWTDGRATLLTIQGGSAADVNSQGLATGTGRRNGVSFGWTYRNGTVTTLATPPGYTHAVTHAVGENGDVVGEAFNLSGSGTSAAVVWRAGQRAATVLAAPAGTGATARGIADNGVIVGSLGDGGIPYRWDADGKGHPLSLPSQATRGQVLGTGGNWAYGWVDGPAVTKPTQPQASPGKKVPSDRTRTVNPDRRSTNRAMTWNVETGQAVVWAIGSEVPTAVGANGWLALPAPGRSGPAQIAHDGRAYPMLGAPDGYPTFVSADGHRVLGLGRNAAGKEIPTSWTC